MSKEKQIEEIDELETVLYEANHKTSVLNYRWLATEAYNAGYRKQSEGKWTYGVDREVTMKCTLCRRRMPKIEHARYCPNCGAKMKGGEE